MKVTSYRDLVKDCIYKTVSAMDNICIVQEKESDCIYKLKKSVVVKLDIAYKKGIFTEYSMVQVEIFVSGGFSNVKNLSSDTKGVFTEFISKFKALYLPLKKDLDEFKKPANQFQRSLEKLLSGVNFMSVINFQDRVFQVLDILSRKGFDISVIPADLNGFMETLKKEHSDIYSDLVKTILFLDSFIENELTIIEAKELVI